MKTRHLRQLSLVLVLGLVGILQSQTQAFAFMPYSSSIVRSPQSFLRAQQTEDQDAATLSDPRTYGSFEPRLRGRMSQVKLQVNGKFVDWSANLAEQGAIQLWGAPLISWPEEMSLKEMDATLKAIVDSNYALFKTHSTDLILSPTRTRYSGSNRYLYYTRISKIDDQPYAVEGAFVVFRFKFNQLIEITNHGFGEVGIVEAPTVTQDEALDAVYQDSGFDETKDRLVRQVRTALQPFYGSDRRIHFRYVYEVGVRKGFPRGVWNYTVSALDAHIVRLMNGVMTAGTVVGDFYPRLPSDGIQTAPLAEVLVSNGTDREQTQTDGTFNMDPQGATAELTDSHASIRESGTSKVTQQADQNGTIHFAADANLSENMAYVHINREVNFVRNFLKSVPVLRQASADDDPTQQDFLNIPIVVNTRAANDEIKSCNAWYDPDTKQLNFLEADDKCEASSHFADIIYHEWGHSLDDALGGGIQDGAFSEGIGDFTASLMTNDHRLAPGFIKGSQEPIRDIAVLKIYPQDRSRDPHQESLIISGAWYEFEQLMKAHYGEEDGRLKTAELWFKHLVSTHHYLDSYMGALVVDDDDGNLDNCTPHMCLLNAAFSKRGLVDPDPRCVDGGSQQQSNLPACAASTIPVPN